MDRLEAMSVFIRVVEAGSFAGAADGLGMPRSTVTTAVQALEGHLKVRLLNRTTRKLSPTPDGEAYYERCRHLIADLEDLESSLAEASRKPRGQLRVDAPANIARPLLIPEIGAFHARYPDVELIFGLSDRRIDLVAEGLDCVIRIGEMEDSSLISRRVGTYHRVACASPAYLSRYGEPRDMDDLRRHKAVNYISWRTGRVFPWEFVVGSTNVDVRMRGPIAVNDADAYVACGLQGLGLIMPPLFMARGHLDSGALVAVLPHHTLRSLPISIVYPENRLLSPKVRVFADWVTEVIAREPLID
ncbi:LysR family transcriptional regulator [Xanthobacteraceae bacterium Astr-EGSB]|uniref:LysR family transcriptional regulator n=1 Tax=Astrobacterium formosum TaxID=3069710 RepID=UPI0027ADCDF2|nr:LysR family transcriptional regulator [Xanthobacteraceae bacterium Astr-EGSB]